MYHGRRKLRSQIFLHKFILLFHLMGSILSYLKTSILMRMEETKTEGWIPLHIKLYCRKSPINKILVYLKVRVPAKKWVIQRKLSPTHRLTYQMAAMGPWPSLSHGEARQRKLVPVLLHGHRSSNMYYILSYFSKDIITKLDGQ